MLETVSLDKALNEKDVVSDAPYILAKTSNGDTVKISKADLASVVAELTGSNRAYKYRNYDIYGSKLLETELDSGCVFVRNSTALDLPTTSANYGLLEIISSNYDNFRYIIQHYYAMTSNLKYERIGTLSGTTVNWTKGWTQI